MYTIVRFFLQVTVIKFFLLLFVLFFNPLSARPARSHVEKSLARDERLVLLYIISPRSFVTILVNSELINFVCVPGIESFLPCELRWHLRLLQRATSLGLSFFHHRTLSLFFSFLFHVLSALFIYILHWAPTVHADIYPYACVFNLCRYSIPIRSRFS